MGTKLFILNKKQIGFIIPLKGPKWELMRATLGKFKSFDPRIMVKNNGSTIRTNAYNGWKALYLLE